MAHADAVDYFGRLACEQPDRRTFFLGLQAVLQARVAGQVLLLKRVAWVEDAIGKLDAASAVDPLLVQYARGVVLAELPERFGKTQVSIDNRHRRRRLEAWDEGAPRNLVADTARTSFACQLPQDGIDHIFTTRPQRVNYDRKTWPGVHDH